MWILLMIKNEIIKSFSRIKTIVFLIILLVAILASGIIFKLVNPQPDDWKVDLEQQVAENQGVAEAYKSGTIDTSGSYVMSESDKEQLIQYYSEQASVFQYAVDHNIPINKTTAWSFATSFEFIVNLVFIFMIVAAAESVASEYSSGNIRYLLIKPKSRWKLLTGKFLSLIASALFFLLVTFLLTAIMGFLFYGFDGAQGVTLSLENGRIIEQSIVAKLLLTYLADLVKLLVVISLAMMISVLMKSGTLSILLSVGVIFSGYILTAILSLLKALVHISAIEWIKYTPFPNLNLAQYLTAGEPQFPGMTLAFSAIVLLVYFILFNTVSYTVFSKRDVY